jgi:hypothetical protein
MNVNIPEFLFQLQMTGTENCLHDVCNINTVPLSFYSILKAAKIIKHLVEHY